MGDRGQNRHGPKRWGLLCPFRALLGPRLIQYGLGRGLLTYQVASSSIQSFGLNGHWTKIGGCAPFGEGKLGPHLTHSRLGCEAYLRGKYDLDPSSRFATINMGRKFWGLRPLFG